MLELPSEKQPLRSSFGIPDAARSPQERYQTLLLQLLNDSRDMRDRFAQLVDGITDLPPAERSQLIPWATLGRDVAAALHERTVQTIGGES